MKTVVSSATRTVVISPDDPFVIIGERINPTNRKKLAEELRRFDFTRVRSDALAQVEAGAQMLDVNTGIPGADEPGMLKGAILAVMEVTDAPISIDSSTPEALEAALPAYKGKALVNSVTGEDEMLERLLPLVKKYGAAVIGIANDDTGISNDPQERLTIARKIVERAADHGIPKEDVIIDPLCMPIGANHAFGRITFETMRLIREGLGVNMSVGAGNVGFGLPDRPPLTASFIQLGMQVGLNASITNALDPEIYKMILAGDLMLGRDSFGRKWNAHFRKMSAARTEGRPPAEKVRVTFLPKETSTRVPAGTTLFHAAAWTGQPIESTCGGRGTCGKCRVQVIEGSTPITPADQDHLSQQDLSAGWRLSCQAEVRDEMVVQVPRLLATPKTAMFGVGRQVLLDPNVHKVRLKLEEPTLHDQRSDYQRVKDTLRAEGFAMTASLPVLRTLPRALREAEFDVTAVLCGETLVAVEPGDTTGECYGVAFDLGTTTIVGTLMDLNNGGARAVASTLNAQAIHGGDVLSRISYTMGKKEGLEELQHFAAFTINGIIEKLATESGVPAARIYEITVGGNLTMMHLLMGIDPEPISVTPFASAAAHGIDVRAGDLGITIHPEGRVYLFPAIGAYVGGDIVAGLLATAVPRGNKLRLFVDVGTNGEIALGSEPRTVATAAPAGPAFEGAEISCGMRASTGAIEGVQITEDAVILQTIDDAPPIGLCGSGLVDVVAQLYKRGLMDATGRMRSSDDLRGSVPDSLATRLVTVDGVRAFVLATEKETGGRPVVFSQKDVRQLQFAKGSIASGIKILMKVMGVEPKDLHEVLLAGAFGSYIHPDAARIIGLVPAVSLDRIHAVGNAAGEGAKIALLSYREREAAEAMPSRVEYIELSGREDFNDIFMGVLGFPPLDSLP